MVNIQFNDRKMMELWKIWKSYNYICELQSEELNEGWSSQLHTQLLQMRKESQEKKYIGRVLHRYRRGQGFESRTSLNFFQAFFSQLQKLRL